MAIEHWHYSRTELAERIYRALALGPTKAISMFGPRQTGKTQFLVKDLGPLAEKRGHKVVFVDFWGKKNSSLAVLLHALDQTLRGGTFMERMKTAIEGFSPKIKLKSPDRSIEIELSADRLQEDVPVDLFFLMDDYCERLASIERPAFLLLDEFQEINRAPYAEDLIAALRSSLNKRGGSFAVVFSGSSQDELRRIFRDRTAPFFAFANSFDLPPLDEEFVRHQVNRYREISGREIERKTALSVFHRFKNNPMVLNRWLGHLVMNPNLDKDEAVANTLDDVAEHFGYRKTWMEIEPEERIAARLIADGLSIRSEQGEKTAVN